MSPNPFLIYCSLLTRSAYRSLRELARLQPAIVDILLLDEAITQAAEARLDLAAQLVNLANNLLQTAPLEAITARTVVSRSYYAAHHALRSLILFVERGDEDGHLGVIEAACRFIASQEPHLDFIVIAPQAQKTADKIVKEVSQYIAEKKGSIL